MPGGNAQSLAAGNVLGKILRIDPHGDDSANGAYGVPARQPVRRAGGRRRDLRVRLPQPLPVLLRPAAGALFVGEVGQNDIEEVDVVTAGGNYGWPIKEGTFLFDTGGPDAVPAP